MRCRHPSRSRRLRDCPAIDSPASPGGLLLPGERVLTDGVAVHGWRLESAEVTYHRKTLMVGGPLLFLLTGVVSALRNRGACRTADAQAAPQWRPLGPLTVLATTGRLLVWHQNAWWSVWYSAIAQATCDGQRLHLQFLGGAVPYLLVGDVSALADTILVRRPVAVGA